MKKVLSLFISFIFLVSILSSTQIVTANNVYTVGDYKITINNKKATITDYTGSDDIVDIPSTIKGYPVIAIGYGAFDCSWFTQVSIPEGVEKICGEAFYRCRNLKSIIIPTSVTTIDYSAFNECYSLNNISLSDNVTCIGNNAFKYTAYYNDDNNWTDGVLYINNHLIEAKDDFITEYIVKEGTKTIADRAFIDHELLEKISLPFGLTYIGEYAFKNCSSLTSVEIPTSVIKIGDAAFNNTTIIGYAGSVAHEFAQNEWNKNSFISLGCYKHSYEWKNADYPECLLVYQCNFCDKIANQNYNHTFKWKLTKKPTIFNQGIKEYKCDYCHETTNIDYTNKKKVKKPKLKFNEVKQYFNVSWTKYSGRELIYVRYRKSSSKKWRVKKWENFYMEDLTKENNYYIQAQLRVSKKGKIAKSDWSKKIKFKLTDNPPKKTSNKNSSKGSSLYKFNSVYYINNNRLVYRTPYGECYHFSYLCGGKNSFQTTYAMAKKLDLSACSKCAR